MCERPLLSDICKPRLIVFVSHSQISTEVNEGHGVVFLRSDMLLI
jgi:hypothetical protein